MSTGIGAAGAWQPGSITQPAGYQLNYQQSGFSALGQPTYTFYFSQASSYSAPASAGYAAPTSNTTPLPPDNSGTSWGRPIPITAGERTIPGELLWWRVRPDGADWLLDCAIGYGWRAEIMAGFNDATLIVNEELMNGTVVYDGTTGFVADGTTRTFYDGTQTTIDPFLAQFDEPAHIYEMYSVWQGVPLKAFGNKKPDSFALSVSDTVEGEPEGGMTLARACRLIGGQTRHLNGQIDVGDNITDVERGLFLVETKSAQEHLLAMGRACNFDMREANDRIEIVRTVDGSDYTVSRVLTLDDLILPDGGSALEFDRADPNDLPSEVRLQYIDSSQTFRWTERPARRENGPKEVTISTKSDMIRVPLVMDTIVAQMRVSQALFRETEARDRYKCASPWHIQLETQPADVIQVPDGDDLVTCKVVRADRSEIGTVNLSLERLHTDQNYILDDGSGPAVCTTAYAAVGVRLGWTVHQHYGGGPRLTGDPIPAGHGFSGYYVTDWTLFFAGDATASVTGDGGTTWTTTTAIEINGLPINYATRTADDVWQYVPRSEASVDPDAPHHTSVWTEKSGGLLSIPPTYGTDGFSTDLAFDVDFVQRPFVPESFGAWDAGGSIGLREGAIYPTGDVKDVGTVTDSVHVDCSALTLTIAGEIWHPVGIYAKNDAFDGVALILFAKTTCTGGFAEIDSGTISGFNPVAAPPITGTLSGTEQPDTAAISGGVNIPATGTLSGTEAPDVAAISGALSVQERRLEDGAARTLEDGTARNLEG